MKSKILFYLVCVCIKKIYFCESVNNFIDTYESLESVKLQLELGRKDVRVNFSTIVQHSGVQVKDIILAELLDYQRKRLGMSYPRRYHIHNCF